MNKSISIAGRHEASLNWLALGLLLAAWNACDDESAATQRPAALRNYPHISVRAVKREWQAP